MRHNVAQAVSQQERQQQRDSQHYRHRTGITATVATGITATTGITAAVATGITVKVRKLWLTKLFGLMAYKIIWSYGLQNYFISPSPFYLHVLHSNNIRQCSHYILGYLALGRLYQTNRFLP
jgi:hypothetical protein